MVAIGRPEPSGVSRRRPTRDAQERSVLERIRSVARRRPGLFRVHRSHSRLYARARRLFGSWAAALAAAGFDHALVVSASNRRALETRRRRRRRRRAPAPSGSRFPSSRRPARASALSPAQAPSGIGAGAPPLLVKT